MKALIPVKEVELAGTADPDVREGLGKELEFLRGQEQWMESTIIEIIISEAQNEVRDFKRWDFDIIPHRVVMKTGFHHLTVRNDVNAPALKIADLVLGFTDDEFDDGGLHPLPLPG